MQSPYSNQPSQGPYPPQSPMYQTPQGYPPPVQPQRKPRRWPWIVAIFVALMIGYASGSGSHDTTATTTQTTTQAATIQPTDAPTTAPAQPTAAPKWITTQRYTGNGTKKTPVFTVPDDWKINYTCQGFTDGSGIDGALVVTVYGSDASYIDGAVNTTCKAGKTTKDTTEEHQGGKVYLDITATGDWTIQVQSLQ